MPVCFGTMSRFFLVFLSCSAFFILLAWSRHSNEPGARLETLPELDFKNPNSTVYIIRHGEKPEDGRRGLSRLGHKRAQCILNLFGPRSEMNISYIIAAPSSKRTRSSRSIDTVKPLAKALDLAIDSHCGAGDAKCVAKRVRKLQKATSETTAKSFNILIAGRHTKIRKITKALGVHDPPKYPDEYDLIWQIQNGQLNISHQHCPDIKDPQSIPDNMDEDEKFSDYGHDEDLYDNAYGYDHAQLSIVD